MLNTYPLWKYLLVLSALVLGILYALPNVYPPDFAIQVTTEQSGGAVTDRVLKVVTSSLEDAGLEYTSAVLQGNNALIRVATDETQLRAKSVMQRALDNEDATYVVVRGDTLSGIADRYAVSMGKIRSYNSLRSSSLRIGQKLKIPVSN